MPLTYPANGSLPTLVQNPFSNSYGATGFFTQFAIGGVPVASPTPAAGRAQLDTGSELFVIDPKSAPKPDGNTLVGPGEPGFEQLGSDTNAYYGHYYLTRVTLMDFAPHVVTVPMKVLIEDVSCPSSGCYNLMGIGFGRPSSAPDPVYGATYKSPLMSTMLQDQNIVQSTNAVAGYTATQQGFINGLAAANAGGFTAASLQALQPYASRAGDWTTPQGCISVNGGPCAASSVLLDTGLPHMLVSGTTIPANNPRVTVMIPSVPTAGGTPNFSPPAFTYTFTGYLAPVTPPTPVPTPPAPPYIELTGVSDPGILVNTGVPLLGGVNYLYDNVCGRAGFQAL